MSADVAMADAVTAPVVGEATLWLDKHRPREFEDILGNGTAVERLREAAARRAIPDLVLYGRPGTGKTTAARCMVARVLGTIRAGETAAIAAARVAVGHRYINASDVRSSASLKAQIEAFLKMRVPELGRTDVRFVLLDEADSMTKDAYTTLVDLMEKYHDSARFIIVCNNRNKLDPSVTTRCVDIHFAKIPDSDLRLLAIRVAREEALTVTADGLDSLVELADGDARVVLNNMSLASMSSPVIDAAIVDQICEHAPPQLTRRLIQACLGGDLIDALAAVDVMIARGCSARDIVHTCLKILRLPSLEMSDLDRVAYLRLLSKTSRTVLDGLDTRLQILGLAAELYRYSAGCPAL